MSGKNPSPLYCTSQALAFTALKNPNVRSTLIYSWQRTALLHATKLWKPSPYYEMLLNATTIAFARILFFACNLRACITTCKRCLSYAHGNFGANSWDYNEIENCLLVWGRATPSHSHWSLKVLLRPTTWEWLEVSSRKLSNNWAV